MSYRLLFVPVLALGVVLWAGVSFSLPPAPQAEPLLVVAAASPKAAAPAKKSTAKPAAKEVKLDMNTLFPPGKGRELVLDNCMNCHSMAPIVVAQKTRGEWMQTSTSHRSMAASLNDAQYNQLFEYLIATFNPSHPVPQLPEELLSGWTNY